MKKKLFGLVAIFSLLLFSCKKQEANIDGLKGQALSADNFFEKVINENVSTSQEKVFYINYEWNTKDKTITLLKATYKEPDFFLIEKKRSAEERAALKYTVTCTNGGKDIWTKECDGKFSCGSLVYECLEGGGCGTICTQRMVFAPQNNSFILLD